VQLISIVARIWFVYRNFANVLNRNINESPDHDASLVSHRFFFIFLLKKNFHLASPLNQTSINNSVRHTSINICSHRNPCGNHGLCQDQIDGSYTCICPLGWKGRYCTESWFSIFERKENNLPMNLFRNFDQFSVF